MFLETTHQGDLFDGALTPEGSKRDQLSDITPLNDPADKTLQRMSGPKMPCAPCSKVRFSTEINPELKAEVLDLKRQLEELDSTIVIAIDGPGASGKGTVSELVGHILRIRHTDSGAYYRCIAKSLRDQGINIESIRAPEEKVIQAFAHLDYVVEHDHNSGGHDTDDAQRLLQIAKTQRDKALFDLRKALPGIFRKFILEFGPSDPLRPDAKPSVFLNNVDVTPEIRSGTISPLASLVGTVLEVRNFVNGKLRELSLDQHILADGRDMGKELPANKMPNSLVVHFWLDADINVRAERRYEEYAQSHESTPLFPVDRASEIADVKRELQVRDDTDRKREFGAMLQADDAISIDTTTLEPAQTAEKILREILEAGNRFLKKRA